MRKPSANGKETNAWNNRAAPATSVANEGDPLLSRTPFANIRSRRASGSRSPSDMNHGSYDETTAEIQQSYNILRDNKDGSAGGDGSFSVSSSQSGGSRSVHQLRRHYIARAGGESPLLEIPEEIYSVRKSALQVLKPLTRTWVSRYFCKF